METNNIFSIETFDQLKEAAVKITGEIQIYNVYEKRFYGYNPGILNCNNETYNIKNNIIIFQESNILYVLPFIVDAVKILATKNLKKEKSLSVIFANNLIYPLKDRDKWFGLLEYSEELAEIYKKIYRSYSSIERIVQVPKKLLHKALLINQHGLSIEKNDNILIFYPIINNDKIDLVSLYKIGTYCLKNDKAVFVNWDGLTYITESKEIIEFLKENYNVAELEIPFKNYKELIDVSIQKKWMRIVEM